MAHRRLRVASACVLLAFTGLWIGHTLEYLRVWGTAGLAGSMTNPVHAYMLPVAGVLATLGALLGLRVLGAWRALNRRLDLAAARLRRLWRGGAAEGGEARQARPSPGTRLVALWLPLATAQIVLYVVQENVEAIARAQPAPGLGAITGIHWAAPLVHLYVSLLLASLVRICEVLLHRRATVVERVEALLRAVARRRRNRVREAARPLSLASPPLQRIGRHLWRRPPPLLLDA